MIRVAALTKRYDATIALDEVDLNVPAGSVYGLVGPNGAGKTTLLSILAGLRRPTSGTIEIDVASDERAVLPDAPRFEKWLTGREVVALAGELGGLADHGRIELMLERAGLSDAADRPVGGFSRGMLQRLGIAATLVANPSLVLLDEPAAALDPAGRREVLDIVERMRGTSTVLFSSHILGDVQAVCDHVGILDRGRLIFEGPVAQVLEAAGQTAYVVRVRNGATLVADRLRPLDWVEAVEIRTGPVLHVRVTSLAAAERNLMAVLAAVDVPIVSVEPEQVSLEQAFLELTR